MSVESEALALVNYLGDQAEAAAQQARPWIERLGRLGFMAKGTVYTLLGALALQVVGGLGGQTTDAQGVLVHVLGAPFGRLLVGLLAVGLAGHALWRFVQAGSDTECKGNGLAGLWARGGYLVVGLVYLGLALSAAGLALDPPSAAQHNGDAAQDGAAWLLAQPLGQWLAGLVGGVIIGNGFLQLYRAGTADFCERLRLRQMSPSALIWATRLGRVGYLAQGSALILIGTFLVAAAIKSSPSQARGLGGTLATLAEQPFGPWLLGAAALGLASYGLYQFVEARFRRLALC